MKTFFLTSALIISASLAHAQDAVFKVMASQGEVVISKPNAADAHSNASSGTRLYKNETLQVQGKSYVGLMHISGQTMQIKAPGTYQVKDLDSKLSAAAAKSVSQRYANYVFDEITKDGDKDHQQFMAVTGSVMRSSKNAAAVKPLIPPTAVLFEGKNTIHWLKAPGTGNTYVFSVSDLYDETVFTKETTDTLLALDFSKLPKLKNEKMCVVRVSVKGKKQTVSDQCALKFLPASDAALVSKDLSTMKIGSDNSGISKVAQAFFYEQNGLYLDALNSYQEALEMEPEVQDYRDMYRNFLVKVGLLETATAATGTKQHN